MRAGSGSHFIQEKANERKSGHQLPIDSNSTRNRGRSLLSGAELPAERHTKRRAIPAGEQLPVLIAQIYDPHVAPS